MTTNKELLALYNSGLLEETAKELNRYGIILQDDNWSVPQGYHKGEHRKKCTNMAKVRGCGKCATITGK